MKRSPVTGRRRPGPANLTTIVLVLFPTVVAISCRKSRRRRSGQALTSMLTGYSVDVTSVTIHDAARAKVVVDDAITSNNWRGKTDMLMLQSDASADLEGLPACGRRHEG